MKQSMHILLLLVIAVTFAGCASFCRIDGPYKGKILDAETKIPLEGVVVLGVWNKVQPTVAGATRSFYDSIEVTTDKNGEFNIKGQGLLLISMIDDEMDIVIFKAGYEMRGGGPWSGFRTRTGSRNVHWNGKYPTILLKKLSYEERKHLDVPRNYTGEKRMPLMTNEINKERVEFGYNPL